MTLRCTQGQAYSADLPTLRNAIRANTLAVPVQIPNTPPGCALSLILNLAHEASGALVAPTASLYTLGFVKAHGTFYFAAAAPLPWAPPVGTTNLGASGSYASLGYTVAPLPSLTAPNLSASALTLSGCNGPVPIGSGTPVADALTRAIIALSETLRFTAAEWAIVDALDHGVPYFPTAAGHQALFTNGSGHGIGL
jgi:Ribosome inactivating protein